jgi:hypothetical protein
VHASEGDNLTTSCRSCNSDSESDSCGNWRNSRQVLVSNSSKPKVKQQRLSKVLAARKSSTQQAAINKKR